MSKEFSRTFRVRWSETNAIGQVDLAGYLRYLIETAWDWGATGGLSMAEHIMDNFLMENPRVIEQQKFPDFQVQPESVFAAPRNVEWRDLDPQEHVNNAAYADFAEQAVAQAFAAVGWPPAQFNARGLAVQNRRFHIQYKAPALWGDALYVSTSLAELRPEGGAWFIEIERASGGETISRCLIEWSLADRASGEEQSLPESLFHALKN